MTSLDFPTETLTSSHTATVEGTESPFLVRQGDRQQVNWDESSLLCKSIYITQTSSQSNKQNVRTLIWVLTGALERFKVTGPAGMN